MARVHWRLDNAGGLRLAFAVVLTLNALALGWFAYRWRRHGRLMHAAAVV
jgi:hypothetical protein